MLKIDRNSSVKEIVKLFKKAFKDKRLIKVTNGVKLIYQKIAIS